MNFNWSYREPFSSRYIARTFFKNLKWQRFKRPVRIKIDKKSILHQNMQKFKDKNYVNENEIRI